MVKGVCVVNGGMCGEGGVHGKQGACVVGGGMHGKGGVHGRGAAWQERWPLQWTVCTLLECILLLKFFLRNIHISHFG